MRKQLINSNYRCLGCAILREEMALEQEQSITFIEGSENIILESEEVKITPPARRKKAEKRNKAGRNSPLLASDEVAINDVSSNILPAGLPAEVSLKQDEKDDVEPQALNNELSSQGDAMNSEKFETKNKVLKDSSLDEVSANDSLVSCVENSFVEANDLAAYANETDSVLSPNDNEAGEGDFNFVNESKEDLEFDVGGENSRESCISPDISANASHDEESFFSAEEAETIQELQSSTLNNFTEAVNETSTELENIEDPSSVNSENTNTTQPAIIDEASSQEISQTQVSDHSDQRSTFERVEELLETTPGLHESANENLSTETPFIESTATDDVCETVRVDSPDSHLSVDTPYLGATGGVLDSDSDSDEEWSSSSYTSSEGEYDIGFAEKFRGIQEVSSLQVIGRQSLFTYGVL